MAQKSKTGKKGNPHPKTEHLEKYKWTKGQKSPNPTGRPKNLISDASRDWLKRIDEKTGKTNAELVAEAQGKVALEGDTGSYCAIRDTTEGRPAQTQQHEIISSSPVKIQIESVDLITAIRNIYGLGATGNESAAAKSVPEGVDRGSQPAQDRNQGT